MDQGDPSEKDRGSIGMTLIGFDAEASMLQTRSRLDQGFRAHVGPMRLDPVQARLPLTRRPHRIPPRRDFPKAGPDAVLAFGVHEYQENSRFILKWAGHTVSGGAGFPPP